MSIMILFNWDNMSIKLHSDFLQPTGCHFSPKDFLPLDVNEPPKGVVLCGWLGCRKLAFVKTCHLQSTRAIAPHIQWYFLPILNGRSC